MTNLTKNLISATYHVEQAREYKKQDCWNSAIEEYESGLGLIAEILQELLDRCTAIEGNNPNGALADIAEQEIKTLKTATK